MKKKNIYRIPGLSLKVDRPSMGFTSPAYYALFSLSHLVYLGDICDIPRFAIAIFTHADVGFRSYLTAAQLDVVCAIGFLECSYIYIFFFTSRTTIREIFFYRCAIFLIFCSE